MQKSAPFCPIKYRFYCISTVLPWQMNNTFILLILSPHIFSKPCKYWLSNLYTLFSKMAFSLINSCIFSCFFWHFGYKWVIFCPEMQKILFFCFCLSHIQKKNGVFTGCWRNFLFLRNKIAIRLHFLKSYSFAIDNIELLLVLIIRIILLTYNFFPSSYAFFIIST